MQHVILKLVNGDEVMGKVSRTGIKIDGIKLVDALSVRWKPNDYGVPCVFMAKYCLFSKEYDVIFRKEHIVNEFAPMDGMIKYYDSYVNHIKTQTDKTINNELKRAANKSPKYDEEDEEEHVGQMTKKDIKLLMSANTTMH